MPLFPIFLKLAGRRCLVVGGGNVAQEKIASLLHAEADLTVVSPEVSQQIRDHAQAGRLHWERRMFAPEDLDGVFVVITATSSPEVNRQVYLLAVERSILCNSVDDPPNCDFYFPALVEREDLQIAISTAGESPALAQSLRKEIDALLAPDLGSWLGQLGQLRRDVLQQFAPSEERKLLLHELARRPLCELADCPSRQLVRASALDRGTKSA
jgi:precorrin-2 dehydrogenase/sirohydrochlorin ferrochelatase